MKVWSKSFSVGFAIGIASVTVSILFFWELAQATSWLLASFEHVDHKAIEAWFGR